MALIVEVGLQLNAAKSQSQLHVPEWRSMSASVLQPILNETPFHIIDAPPGSPSAGLQVSLCHFCLTDFDSNHDSDLVHWCLKVKESVKITKVCLHEIFRVVGKLPPYHLC
jgi:hypothetical protein